MLATKIIAHRGLSSLFPENTLIAMKAAAKVGATWIETDVQILKDGIPVIMHDKDLGRTSNEQGVISNMTEREIEHIDVGSWFDEKFTKERIPLLGEMLELIDELNLGMNLEIKYHKGYHDTLSSAEIENVVKMIMSKLSISPKPPRGIIISSFYTPFLEEVRKIDSKINIGCLYETWDKDGLKIAKDLGAVSIHLYKNNLLEIDTQKAKKIVDKIKAQDMDIYVYTVNNISEAKQIFDLNVDGIFTDYPQSFNRYLP